MPRKIAPKTPPPVVVAPHNVEFNPSTFTNSLQTYQISSSPPSTTVSFAALPLPERALSSTPPDTGSPTAETEIETVPPSYRRGSASTVISVASSATVVPGYASNPVTPSRTPLIAELEEGTDPLQWSEAYKAWANTVYCIMILSTTFGSSAYSASAPQVEVVFNVGRTVATLGTSLYVLGFALGPLAFGPSSEVVGRKPVYLVSFVLLTAFNIGVCFAQTIEGLLICRFFAGFMGSSALNNVAASIVDMTHARNRLRYNSAYRLVSFGGPTLGPLIGAFVVSRADWRWNLRILPIFSGIILVIYAFTVPESHRATIARKQAARREREMVAEEDGDDMEKGLGMKPSALNKRQLPGPTLAQRYKVALMRPFIFIFTEPMVMVVSLYTAILYGLLYGLFGAFPYVFGELRGWTAEQTGLTYLSVFIGFTIGAVVIGCWVQDRQIKRAFDTKTYTPEGRIGPALWASFCVPIGLFIFAWTAPYSGEDTYVHWVVPCLGMAIFAFGMQVVFNSWLSYLADAYGPNAASSMAAATFSRSILGTIFPLFMRQMLIGMTVQGAISLFAAIGIPLSLAGFWFVKKGPQLRENSKYAAAD